MTELHPFIDVNLLSKLWNCNKTEEFQDIFEAIATELMNNYSLATAGHKYKIIECEFYYNDQNRCNDQCIHSDPYTHCHDEQLKSGTWYFHGSGLDITIGRDSLVNAESKSANNVKRYGGILIRSIKSINSSKSKSSYFCGPLNAITELFSSFEHVTSDKNKFQLIKDKQENENSPKVVRSNRIGLKPSLKDKDNYFYNAQYRFISDLNAPFKNKVAVINKLVLSNEISSDAAAQFLKQKIFKAQDF